MVVAEAAGRCQVERLDLIDRWVLARRANRRAASTGAVTTMIKVASTSWPVPMPIADSPAFSGSLVYRRVGRHAKVFSRHGLVVAEQIGRVRSHFRTLVFCAVAHRRLDEAMR